MEFCYTVPNVVTLCFVLVHISNCEVRHGELDSQAPKIKQGMIRGQVVDFPGRNGPSLQPVVVFLGIKYAHVFRFLPSSSVRRNWQHVKGAVNFSAVCSQRKLRRNASIWPYGFFTQMKRKLQKTDVQLEDCLSLNIYVPRKSGKYYIVSIEYCKGCTKSTFVARPNVRAVGQTYA